jgi:hypothetical protein
MHPHGSASVLTHRHVGGDDMSVTLVSLRSSEVSFFKSFSGATSLTLVLLRSRSVTLSKSVN